MSERTPNEIHDDGAVLERNVEQLLSHAHEPPVMAAEAKERVRAFLVDRARERRATGSGTATAGPRPRLGRRPLWAGAGALAAGLAAAAVVAVVGGGKAPAPIVAEQTDGVRTVALADGSEMILNRGARAVVLGDRRVRVDAGDVLFDVAPGKGRFVVDAPQGSVTALGTRFVVSAAGDQTRAAVVRGRVRVDSGAGSAVLGAGDEALLRPGAEPVRRRAPRLSHLVGWARLARRQEEKPGPAPVRKGALIARNPNWQEHELPLPLRALKVDVYVENQVARVALDQTFFNPHPERLEGVYHLSLPPDASISRQAMYVDGTLMESAMVERKRAREIYDDIVYRRRDPALMEWMAGNVYKVRIFPLPARTEKRIVFAYTQALSRLYDDYRIEVPMPESDGPARSVDVHVRLAGCAGCAVASPSHTITTTVDGDDLVVTSHSENQPVGDDLVLRVRDPQKAPRVVTDKRGERNYLMVRVQPQATDASAAPPPRKRRRWVLLADTSASRGPLETKAQAFFIDHLVRELDEEDEIAVMSFDTAVRRFGNGFTAVDHLDRRALHDFLTAGGGGAGYTDIGAALDAAVAALGDAGGDLDPYVLYIGDGIATGGERAPAALAEKVAGHATFIGAAVGDRADGRLLGALADATGGLFESVSTGDDLAWRAFDLVAALETPRVVDLEATLVDAAGKTVDDASVYPSSHQLADGEELSVVARLGATTPVALELHGRRDGAAWSYRAPLEHARGGARYLPREWARRRIDDLLRSKDDGARAEVTELGVKNFLMTPYTSMLVLENDEMYQRFGVKRDRSRKWAAYKLPAHIKVVHETLGTSTAAAAANVRLDAALLRAPTRVLASYGAPLGESTEYGEGDFWLAPDIGGVAAFRQTKADADGALVIDLTSASAHAGFDASAEPRAQEAVSTLQVQSGPGDWTVVLGATAGLAKKGKGGPMRGTIGAGSGAGRGGGGSLGHAASHRMLSGRRTRDRGLLGWGNGYIALDGSVGYGRFGGYRYGYYGNAAAYPVAFQYPTDPRLDDLTEQTLGLFPSAFDVDIRALAASAGNGSVSVGARALIDEARRHNPSGQFHAGDLELELGKQRMRVSRRLDSGLREEVVLTGDELWRLYPELGLAAKRSQPGAAALVYSRWAPFVMPPADALGRYYVVTRPSPRVLRLTMADGSGSPVEYELDNSGRVREMRRITPGGAEVLLRVAWKSDRVVLTQEGLTRTLVRDADGGDVSGIDPSAWTVVDMPLRQPAYWTAELAKAGAGQRHLRAQLMASYAALGNAGGLAKVATALAADAPLTRGELTLASRGLAMLKSRALREALRGTDADDPVAAYIRAAQALQHHRDNNAFESMARRDGFVGALAGYRTALGDIQAGHSRTAASRVRRLADGRLGGALLYVAAYMYAGRFGWQASERAASVWDAVAAASSGEWRTRARTEAARRLYNRGHYDDAADRFQQIADQLPDNAPVPILDQMARWSFANSSRGQVGWQLFWARWQRRARDAGDLSSLLSLAQSARMVGDQSALDRVSGKLVELGASDAGAAAAAAQVLFGAGRAEEAMTVIEPYLDHADADLLAQASYIRERQGRLAEAADLYQRAVDAAADEPAKLSAVRSDYSRLIGLYDRLARTRHGAGAQKYVDRLLAVAAAWRAVDPDNATIDAQVGAALEAAGRDSEAWRQLTCVIERHPGDGAAYQVVADALEKEGRVARAETLWRRAMTVEPENPAWRLRLANALLAQGDRKGADAQLQRIAKGDWHERFEGVVYQARKLLRRR